MNMSDRLTWSLFLKYLYDIYMNLPMFVHLFFYMKSIHEHVQIVCFPELQLKWFSPRTYQYLKVSKFTVLQKKDLEAVCYPTFILGGGEKAVELKLFIETIFYSTHRHSVFVDFIKMGFGSLQWANMAMAPKHRVAKGMIDLSSCPFVIVLNCS